MSSENPCRIEVYVNDEEMLCDPGAGEARLETRQILLHRDLRMTLLSRTGKTKLRQISAESVQI